MEKIFYEKHYFENFVNNSRRDLQSSSKIPILKSHSQYFGILQSFYQWLNWPQVTQDLISSMKIVVYKLARELPNDLRLRTFGN